MVSLLLPYQSRWVRDRSRVKIAVKSRRIGITWATAYEACEVAAAADGSNFWYQTYAEDDAKEFIEDVAKWARQMDLVFRIEEEELDEDEAQEYFLLPNGEYSIKITSVRFRSGYRVIALPHSPRKLRGKGGVYCLDEAAFHEDLEGALKAAEAFQIWGGRLIFISTVTDEDSAFTRLFRDAQSGKEDYSLHIVTLPDAFSEGLYKRVCLKTGREWSQEREDVELARLLKTKGAEQEFLCIPLRSGGSYFPPALTQPCMIDAPVLRVQKSDAFLMLEEEERASEMAAWILSVVAPVVGEMPETRPTFLGMDFGRSSDMSVLAPGQLTQDLRVQVPFMVELSNIPYEQQKQLLRWMVENLPRNLFVALDATGNGSYLGEYAVTRWGEERAEAIKLTLPWYAENLPRLRARFEDRTLLIPRDLDVQQDLSMFEVIDGVPRLPKKRIAAQREDRFKGEVRHGDAGIALAMLDYAASRPRLSYSYQKTAKRGGRFAYEGLL